MVCKDEVCMWFKDNESHRRLELICGLLNMCLPFELRFIRTCVEDLGKRGDLSRDFDSKANSSSEISQLGKVLDERTRSKFVVYVALLEANNQTCSKILFETLSNEQQIPNSALSNNLSDNINYINEMLLIYTMVLHHPAFTFEEKRSIGERFQSLKVLEEEISKLSKNKKSWSREKSNIGLEVNSQDLSLDSCHPMSSPQVFEACDSGLSIGTEPEVELLPHESCNSSHDNTFEDISSKEVLTTGRPVTNPSIGTRNSDNLPSNFVGALPSSSIPPSPPSENVQPCPPNRDASSSGSGESLDMYGESVSVPTTYIYNSNIYDHQNLSEVPVPVTSRKGLSNGCSSETSSGEEVSGVSGGPLPSALTQPHPLKQNSSPMSSSQSSPYASPPQSLTPSRASSPKEKVVTTFAPSGVSSVTSQAGPYGQGTGTTTSVVISRSSPKPPIRQSSGSSSSHPSSPAVSISHSITHNKSPVVSKPLKYVSDRPPMTSSGNHISPNICSTETVVPLSIQVHSGPITTAPLGKEVCPATTYPCSFRESLVDGKVHSPCKTPTKYVGGVRIGESNLQPCDTSVEMSVSPGVDHDCHGGKGLLSNGGLTNIPLVPSTSCLKGECSVVPTSSVSPENSEVQVGSHNGFDVNQKNLRNPKEDSRAQKDNSVDIKSLEEMDKLKCRHNIDDKKALPSVPNGYLLISSAQSVPVKHSIVQASSVPSCSCMHATSSASPLSETCKTSVSNVTSVTITKFSTPVLVSVGSELLGPKSNQNKSLFSTEVTQVQPVPQSSSLPLIGTNAITHTVPSKVQHSGSPPVPSSADMLLTQPDKCVANVSVSLSPTCKTVQQFKTSTAVSTSSSQTSTCTSTTPKYTTAVTMCPPNALTSQPLVKPPSGENPLPLPPAPPPSIPNGQVLVGGAKATPVGTSIPTYTTSSSASSSLVSLVPSPGAYPPYISFPVIPGGSSYLPQGAYTHHGHGPPRTPSHTFFITSAPGMTQGPHGHLMKATHPHSIPQHSSNMSSSKSRGSSSGRSGSSSSSSSSGIGRKKTFVKGNQYQSKSRSSDSSPSSSQYSSPPQTPSPDHTKDARTKSAQPSGKCGEGSYPVEEVWDAQESSGPCLPCNGPREEGTPPPHPMAPHIMIPSNHVRQRYIPYHPSMGFIGYPSHPGMYRYSLPSPAVVMGPRPSTPLSSEKSSRETTPPNHIPHAPLGALEPPPKAADFPNTMCGIASNGPPLGGPSSASPPIPGGPPIVETSSVPILSPPGPPSGHSAPPNPPGIPPPQFNHPGYPMFAMGTNHFVAHMSGFLPSSGLTNGYVSPHTVPPNFPVPSINSGELVYPSSYPVMAQTTLATSSCGAHPILHQSSNGHHTPVMGPSSALPPYSPPFQAPPPPNPVPPPPVKKPLTCYNCGKVGHRGSECKEASIDELTKRTKVL